MAKATIAGNEVTVNEEGFLTEFDEWNEEIGAELAKNIDVEMTDAHWALIKWLREDYKENGETATTRRVNTAGGVPTKQQFALFPKKPAKKMSYVAGLPKPKGCV
jgi:tRNA 2-thiouridine synthesizing protein E